jgi:hypothetical protein
MLDALRHISSAQKGGVAKIDVKYTDLSDKEWRPYSFSFDLDQVILNYTKKSLFDDKPGGIPPPWLVTNYLSSSPFTYISLNPSWYSKNTHNGIEKILYGLDTETLNMEWPTDNNGIVEPFKFKNTKSVDEGWTAGLVVEVEGDIEYITAQIIFKDGTSTDIRKFKFKW